MRIHKRRSAYPLSVALLLSATNPTQAIDPLPPEIERASEEIQLKYIDREGKISMEEKIKVGKKRYQRRVEAKRDLNQAMRIQAASVHAQVTDRLQGRSSGESQVSGFLVSARWWLIFGLFGLFIIGVFRKSQWLKSETEL
jgi:hypothetical protein